MTVSLATIPCLSVREAYRACREQGRPVGWADLAHSYTCELGPAPGDGWLLMSLAQLKRVDPTLAFAADCDLVIGNDNLTGPTAPPVVIRSLCVVGAECVAPGARGDDAAYLVRLADKRLLLNRRIIDRGYNLRDRATGALVASSTSGGVAWTWQQVLSELWSAAGLTSGGDALPVAPDGTPEGIELWQTPALDAVEHVLARLGCSLRYDPTAATFSVADTGGADAAADAALARWDRWRVDDAYPIVPGRTARPRTVRVLFPRLQHVAGEGSPWWPVDVADPAASGEAGTYATVSDDLPALMSAGSPSNLAALTSRASFRAAAFLAETGVSDRLRLAYPLAVAEPGLLPGPRLACVRWQEQTAQGRLSGVITLITRRATAERTSRPPLSLPSSAVAQSYQADVGDGASTTLAVTHGLGTQDAVVVIRQNSSPFEQVFPTVSYTTIDTVSITFATPPTTNQYRVVVMPKGGGPGSVRGPAGGSTDDALTRFDGGDGQTVQSSSVLLSDAGDLTAVRSVTGPAGGSTFTGGTATDDTLTLRPTSHATPGTGTTVIEVTSADTTQLRTLLRLRNLTTVTPAVGMGTTWEVRQKNDAGTEIVLAALDAVFTAVGAGVEYGDWVFRARVGGVLAELGRLVAGAGLRLPTEGAGPAAPPAGTIAVWGDAATKALLVTNEDGTVTPLGVTAAVPRWSKVATKTYAQLAAAAISNSVEVYSLPAGAAVHGALVKHSAAFTGGAIATYTASVGYLAAPTALTDTLDVKAAPTPTGFAANPLAYAGLPRPIDFGSVTSVRVYVNSSGAFLDAATAGSLDVWLCVGVPP